MDTLRRREVVAVTIARPCVEPSMQLGRLAQLVARMLSMHKVAGSIPAVSTLLEAMGSRWTAVTLVDSVAESIRTV